MAKVLRDYLFYEEPGITLYCGDCREVLPLLKCPDTTYCLEECSGRCGGIGLVITDPPYRSLDIDVIRGTTTRLVGGGGAASRKGGKLGVEANWFPTLADADILAALDMLPLAPAGALYVFGDVKTGLALFPLLSPKNVLVWDKGVIGMGYSWRRMYEWIAYCPRPDHRLRSQSFGDIIRCPSEPDKRHATEKPLGVITPLILNSSDADDAVLDPFAGSGTTLEAAKLTGRRAIGIEIEPKYCEIAVKRLRQEVLAL